MLWQALDKNYISFLVVSLHGNWVVGSIVKDLYRRCTFLLKCRIAYTAHLKGPPNQLSDYMEL